jgi:hypothetical protein
MTNIPYDSIIRPVNSLKEDRKNLYEWSQIPGRPDVDIFGVSIYNIFHPISQRDVQMGSLVNISMMIQNVEMDANLDGDLSEEEKKAAEARNQTMIDQFIGCVGTSGVIGALVFSGLCSAVINPLVPCDQSLRYFGEDRINQLAFVYYIFIYAAFLLSCYVVINSFLIFMAVNLWMPNCDLRSWYIRKGAAVVRLLCAAAGTIVCCMIGVPLAIAINVGPGQAVIGFIMGFVTLLFGSLEFAHMAGISCRALHSYCREKLFADPQKQLERQQSSKRQKAQEGGEETNELPVFSVAQQENNNKKKQKREKENEELIHKIPGQVNNSSWRGGGKKSSQVIPTTTDRDDDFDDDIVKDVRDSDEES